jgi:hypothetical protein
MTGLLFGTTITLLFIPALYSILYKVDATKQNSERGIS